MAARPSRFGFEMVRAKRSIPEEATAEVFHAIAAGQSDCQLRARLESKCSSAVVEKTIAAYQLLPDFESWRSSSLNPPLFGNTCAAPRRLAYEPNREKFDGCALKTRVPLTPPEYRANGEESEPQRSLVERGFWRDSPALIGKF